MEAMTEVFGRFIPLHSQLCFDSLVRSLGTVGGRFLLVLAVSMPCGRTAWAAADPSRTSAASRESTPGFSPLPFVQAQMIFQDVIQSLYPELAPFRIVLETFESSDDYLEAMVRPGSILTSAANRDYVVRINPRLLQDPPTEQALRAIFTHELSHIRDYTQMSSLSLVTFVARYVVSSIQGYEHHTDLVAMEKGQGEGLIEFREWLYRHETGAALVAKMRDYYQPAEIEVWLQAQRASQVRPASPIQPVSHER